MENFDYIILGAGSAGCVLANRLSENPKNKVLLIEASIKRTLFFGFSDSLFARTQPADPAPKII